MGRLLLRFMLVFIINNRKHKTMKKNIWGTILKVIIAVASAVAGALGYSAIG